MNNQPAPSLPDRSLDKACAEKMGKEVIERLIPRTGNYQILVSADNAMTGWMNLPHYSENVVAALQLVEYATSKNKNLHFELARRTNGTWFANFEIEAASVDPDNNIEHYGYGDTGPEAVCRAFLALDLSLAGEG